VFTPPGVNTSLSSYIRNDDDYRNFSHNFGSGVRTIYWNTYSGDGSWVGGYRGDIVDLKWNGVAVRHNGNSLNCADILSSRIRDTDPTILDVVYKITSRKPSVKVRVLAFEDGERSFAKVVRPETFVTDTNGVDTACNVGDNVTPNVEHTISWRVSSDWKVKLAKVRLEVLSCEGELLPLEFMTIPASTQYGKMRISWNSVFGGQAFDALMWLYADKTADLSCVNGVLKTGTTQLASGTEISAENAMTYIFGKMGYSRLVGAPLTYANSETRLGLSPSGARQYAYKIVEE